MKVLLTLACQVLPHHYAWPQHQFLEQVKDAPIGVGQGVEELVLEVRPGQSVRAGLLAAVCAEALSVGEHGLAIQAVRRVHAGGT